MDLSWIDSRLKWPQVCWNKTSLKSFALDEKVWEAFWTPSIHIESISTIEPVKQLRPSLYLKVGQVRSSILSIVLSHSSCSSCSRRSSRSSCSIHLSRSSRSSCSSRLRRSSHSSRSIRLIHSIRLSRSSHVRCSSHSSSSSRLSQVKSSQVKSSQVKSSQDKLSRSSRSSW
jgi:hypothetical protein